MNRMKLSRGVEQQGHTVDVAENGKLALEMLRANSFDLVLLDIIMPEMDGYEGARANEARHEPAPHSGSGHLRP